MNIKEALFNYLSTYSGIDRVYPDWLPQNPTYPAVTYNRVSTQRDKAHCGTLDHLRSVFQVDAWGTTYAQAENQAVTLREALIDFRGEWGGSPSVKIDKVFIDNDSDQSDAEPGLYRVTLDVVVWHF